MTSRADIMAMGTVCMQLGLTPEDVQEVVHRGAICHIHGISDRDLKDLGNIKWRARND